MSRLTTTLTAALTVLFILPAGMAAAKCPPGLAKKSPACVPPGLAKKAPKSDDRYRYDDRDRYGDRDRYRDYDDRHYYRVGDRIHGDYRRLRDPGYYDLNRNDDYVVYDDYVYRIDPQSRKVLNLIGAIADLTR